MIALRTRLCGGIAGGDSGSVTLNNDSVVQGNDPDDCEPDIGACQ